MRLFTLRDMRLVAGSGVERRWEEVWLLSGGVAGSVWWLGCGKLDPSDGGGVMIRRRQGSW